MGARGNSGVITSQILRGLAEGLAGKTRFNGLDLANALDPRHEDRVRRGRASRSRARSSRSSARRRRRRSRRPSSDDDDGVGPGGDGRGGRASPSRRRRRCCRSCARPASSTRAARACSGCSRARSLPSSGRARSSAAAGAGCGRGSARGRQRGRTGVPPASRRSTRASATRRCSSPRPRPGKPLDVDAIRDHLESIGDSVLVAGDARAVKVHVHNERPGRGASPTGWALGQPDADQRREPRHAGRATSARPGRRRSHGEWRLEPGARRRASGTTATRRRAHRGVAMARRSRRRRVAAARRSSPSSPARASRDVPRTSASHHDRPRRPDARIPSTGELLRVARLARCARGPAPAQQPERPPRRASRRRRICDDRPPRRRPDAQRRRGLRRPPRARPGRATRPRTPTR